MAYQVLARKWRPTSFANLKGQSHVLRALTNALKEGYVHHAYLFTGTRGVGKTTLARILAKALNCELGISSEPCTKCATCLAIDAGKFIDLIEVDGASRTRVEDTRELLENVQYAPSVGRFKIYLIDEVHMLSSHSFNALLKTLEEPPSHVKFILATTTPERIPVTVLSRCLCFHLTALSPLEITEQLEKIVSMEGFSFEKGACQKIAHEAKGSMRDALSLLEQAIAFSNGALKVADLEVMLGTVYLRYLPALMLAVVTKDVKNALEIIEEMVRCGADFEQVLASILKILHAIAILQVLPEVKNSLASLAELDPAYYSLKDHLSQEETQLLYQIGLIGQKDLRFAPDSRTGFEMILLRMIVFRPEDEISIKAQAPLEKKVFESTPAPMPKTEGFSVRKQSNETSGMHAVCMTGVGESSQETIGEGYIQKEPVTTTMDWLKLSDELGLSGFSKIIVKNSVISKWNEQHLFLILDEAQKACLNSARQMQIQEALSQYFKRAIKVTITVGKIEGFTPSMQEIATENERIKDVQKMIEQNKTVQDLLSTFDGTIEKTTVL